MLHWALVFFVVALVAAIFGYSGMAGTAAVMAEVLFFAFLVLAIAMLVGAMVSRRPHVRPR